LYRLLGSRGESGDLGGSDAGDGISRLSNVDLVAGLQDFYSSPDLWLGVVASVAMLAAAVWVRRYRDETS
jgi:hypothetical protein